MRINRDDIKRKLDADVDEMFTDFAYHYELDFDYLPEHEEKLSAALENLIDVMVDYMKANYKRG